MAQIMTNQEFVDRLLKVREKYKTCYASGTFGQCATPSFIDQKKKQYPKWYTDVRVNNLKALSDDTRLFDCVGLIKGVLWGFPNTKYKSNGVAEGNDQDYWNMALDKSKSFSQIQIGELLWLKGHVGVYIGNGKAIECTASWYGNVQITAVQNIGPITGLNSRRWEGHGKIPYIKYMDNENKVNPGPSGESKIDVSKYPILRKGSKGVYVTKLQTILVQKKYDPKGIDGIFGPGCDKAVRQYQKDHKLVVDGCVGPKTWNSLLNS